MAALRPAYQFLLLRGRAFKHLVNPWAGGVEDDGRARLVRPAAEKVFEDDAARRAVLDEQTLDARVCDNSRAARTRVERVLDREPLGVLDLRVVEERRAAQALGFEAGRVSQRFPPVEHAVARERLGRRKQVVGEHPGAYGEESAAAPRVDGHEHRERADEVRRDLAEQRLTLA